MKRAHITLICGGIGSGKSVVSRILRTMGYAVYDCDAEARRIMDTSVEIMEAIEREVCPGCVIDNQLNRSILGEAVFADKARLTRLNQIVHGAVREDIAAFAARHASEHVFVETAIPNSGKMCHLADDVWLVEAPEDVRIARVQKRNNLTAEQVRARIESQRADAVPCHDHVTKITNDNTTALLPQVLYQLQ